MAATVGPDMSSYEVLVGVVDELGYRDSPGYVDVQHVEVGSRGPVWTDLRDKCGMTAAFFKGAVPVVAFVAVESHDEAMLAHRRLWNYGRVPILIATTDHEILALSCNTAPTDGGPDAAVLERAVPGPEMSRLLDDFTRYSVESGKLHRNRGRHLDKLNRVDQSLLRNLRLLRSRLLETGVLEGEIEPLLGRTIFVRYLEDREILRPQELKSLGQPESLADALDMGWDTVSTFFSAMAEHFSGDVFRSDTLPRPIPARALAELSLFFHGGDLETGQAALWPYDFAIIPPELISSIYEQLLVEQQKADAAYYTPRHMVDLVLDELLPLDGPVLDPPTVFDPACGSGIFLTEAFRRLVGRRSRATQNSLDYQALQGLLVDSIFGVDRNADAVGVAAFGLYLALLEHVDPRTVWLQARLPQLVGRNLVVSDFFEDNPLSDRTFDVIVGNPPWQSKLPESAQRYVRDGGHAVPDRQIAVAFVWKIASMLSMGGTAGLVLPSKSILHNRSEAADRFRRELFDQLDVQTIIDLSPLRKDLFGSATSPAVVTIFGLAKDVPREHLLHVSPRRTPISEIVDGIAIPQQNIQRVSRAQARSNSSIWKTLLWGGLDDVNLISHLRESFEPLTVHAEERGWVYGAGFQERGGDHNDASHLHEIPLIRTQDVGPLHPPTETFPPITSDFMHRPRDGKIFRAPHILLRNGFAKTPIAAYAPFDAAFPDGLFAIGGPADESLVLSAVAAVLNSSIAQYWYFMTASSWGVEREKVELREWLSLPLPLLSSTTVSALAEITSAVSGGQAEVSWRPELDKLVADAYELNDSEQQLIADALHVRLSEYQDGPRSIAYLAPNDDDYVAYIHALKEEMDVLQLDEWVVELAERRDDFARVTCTHQGGNDSNVGNAEGRGDRAASRGFTIDSLLQDDDPALSESFSSTTIVEPQAIVLDGERIHIIKPNRRSCWTISSAAQDAADVFGALVGGHV